MTIPKHEPNKPNKKGKGATKKAETHEVANSAAFVDMTSVADAIDGLRSVISTWVTQERNGDNGSSLYSSPGAYPVRVRLITDDDLDVFDGIVGTLEEQGDKQAAALERIATAFERIADAMPAKTVTP
jgi:hypothetical protein